MVVPNQRSENDLAQPGLMGRRPEAYRMCRRRLLRPPELLDRPRRRTFTAQDEAARFGGGRRRGRRPGGSARSCAGKGLYSSTLSDWRRQRDSGALRSAEPAKRGPKTAARNPLAAELVQSRRENSRLGRRLEHAEAIIEIQKNLADRGPACGVETVVTLLWPLEGSRRQLFGGDTP